MKSLTKKLRIVLVMLVLLVLAIICILLNKNWNKEPSYEITQDDNQIFVSLINKDLEIHQILFGDYFEVGEDIKPYEGYFYEEVKPADGGNFSLQDFNKRVNEIYYSASIRDSLNNYPEKYVPMLKEFDGKLYRNIEFYEDIMQDEIYKDITLDNITFNNINDLNVECDVKISDLNSVVYVFEKTQFGWMIDSMTYSQLGSVQEAIVHNKAEV